MSWKIDLRGCHFEPVLAAILCLCDANPIQLKIDKKEKKPTTDFYMYIYIY